MKLFSYIFIIVSLQACVSYSFIDGSIDAETFSVSTFEEQAANAPAGYGGQFTDYLKDFVIGRSKLKLQNINADIIISGKISNYGTTPLAVTANQVAALNRLSITVNVSVLNNVKPEESFEKTITQFSDYESSNDLSAVETELLEDINGKLAQDIINELTSNW